MLVDFLDYSQGHVLAWLGLGHVLVLDLKRIHLLLEIGGVAEEVDRVANPYDVRQFQNGDGDAIEIVCHLADPSVRHDNLLEKPFSRMSPVFPNRSPKDRWPQYITNSS